MCYEDWEVIVFADKSIVLGNVALSGTCSGMALELVWLAYGRFFYFAKQRAMLIRSKKKLLRSPKIRCHKQQRSIVITPGLSYITKVPSSLQFSLQIIRQMFAIVATSVSCTCECTIVQRAGSLIAHHSRTDQPRSIPRRRLCC